MDIISSTSWFSSIEPSLQKTLASKMIREEVEEGHVFFWEGTVIDSIIIIESGRLMRSKAVDREKFSLSAVMEQGGESSSSSTPFQKELFEKNSVDLDEISGKGRVTGMLRVINEEHSRSYATLRSVGRSVVWRIPADDFMNILSSDAGFAMMMLRKVAHKMKAGSKSLKNMLKNSKKTFRRGPSSSLEDEDDDAKGRDTISSPSRKAPVRVLCYDTTQWVKSAFEPAVQAFNKLHSSFNIEMDFTNDRLSEQSSMYAAGYDAVCLFVNDSANANTLRILSMLGVRFIAMRCAGFDRVDAKSAKAHGLTVARVPAYSPYAVAEHAISLLMSINRKIPAASTRVKMANFTLDNSLLGMDIHGKTVGIMGTGKVGQILCKILNGFGANLICYDIFESDEVKKLGAEYVSRDYIYEEADILFLMMPLLPTTIHTINADAVSKMKDGVLLINTARGGLIDTKALILGLQSGKIGGVGLDVLENEADYFFQDWSAKAIEDPELTSLLGNNRVVLTAHQAFFTKEAVSKIVDTTLDNIKMWKNDGLEGLEHPNNCLPSRMV